MRDLGTEITIALVLDRHVDVHLEATGKSADEIASEIVTGTVEADLDGALMAHMVRSPLVSMATKPASSG